MTNPKGGGQMPQHQEERSVSHKSKLSIQRVARVPGVW